MIGHIMTDAAIVSELGERLRATRLRKNLSQAEVARRAGISTFTVNQMEAGKSSSLASLISVMRALGLLEQFEQLIPEVTISPIAMAAARKKRRLRASTPRHLRAANP